LLCSPWTVDTSRIPGFESLIEAPLVKVPNLASYIMQKVLIRDQGRSIEKKGKDCYYIYEVSVIFREHLEEVAAALVQVAKEFHASWLTRFLDKMDFLFKSPSAEGPVSVSRISRDLQRLRGDHPSISPEMALGSV